MEPSPNHKSIMRITKIAYCLALLFAGTWISVAQTDSLRLSYSVSGKVTDARTGQALPAVNVVVPGRNYATVSNSDGVFVIKSDAPIRELLFSHLGYKALRTAVSGDNVAAKLTPEKYLLDPSSIVSGDPLEIVRSAIVAVRDNYSQRPELLRGFYRETMQKRGRYISVTEAVLRMYKNSYQLSTSSDKTALDKSRIIVSQRKRDTLSVKMMGGPALAVTADAVKDWQFLFSDICNGLYFFRMDHPEYIGDRLQFVIHISPAFDAPCPLYDGTLYIDRESLAFTRIELHLDLSDPEKAARQLLVRKPAGLRFVPRELSYVMSYRPSDGINRMEYFRATMAFDCDWKKRGLNTSYVLVNETVITDVLQPAEPIARSEQFRQTDILADKAAYFTDPAFWEDYNIIAPSESLEHAVSRLRKDRH